MRRVRLGVKSAGQGSVVRLDDLPVDVQAEAEAGARAAAESTPQWSTLTGVDVDPERGSAVFYIAGRDEPLRLAVNVSEIPAAEQVRAVAALTPAGVPAKVHASLADRRRVVVTTSSAEFGMYSVAGVTLRG